MNNGIYIIGLFLILFFLGLISITIDMLSVELPQKPRWLVSDEDYPAREE